MRPLILLFILTRLTKTQENESLEEEMQPVPPAKEETGSEQASEEAPEQDDDSDIIIDPLTPVARFEWINPGHPKRFDDFNPAVPSGSNFTLEWKYTAPVIRRPRTLTLFRTREPQPTTQWLQPSDWTEIATFPYKANQRKLKITIGGNWFEGSSYFFRLQANYGEGLANSPGSIVNGAVSAGLKVYHRSADGGLRFGSGAVSVAPSSVMIVVLGHLAALLLFL